MVKTSASPDLDITETASPEVALPVGSRIQGKIRLVLNLLLYALALPHKTTVLSKTTGKVLRHY